MKKTKHSEEGQCWFALLSKQTTSLLQRKQAAHPHTIYNTGKLSGFPQWVKIKTKTHCNISSHSLPTLLQQFRLLSEAGTRTSFPQFIRQAPLEAGTQGIPTLWHIWAKENRTPEPDTEHLISYLCSLCQGSCGSLFIKLRRHMAYNKSHGEGCPCLGSLFSATLNLSLPRSSTRYVFFYFILSSLFLQIFTGWK